MAKCFDLAYIYTKLGVAEINMFSYENQLQRKWFSINFKMPSNFQFAKRNTYSDKYSDSAYEYRHVTLSQDCYERLPH